MPDAYDELGNAWKVPGGTPSARQVNRLKRGGYHLIVLPLRTLVSGELAEPVEQPADVIRSTRLRECLDYLRG